MPSPVPAMSHTDCGNVAHLLEDGLVQIRLCCAVVIFRSHRVRRMGSSRHAQARCVRPVPLGSAACSWPALDVLRNALSHVRVPAEANPGRAPSA